MLGPMPPDEDVTALLGAGYGTVLWEPGPQRHRAGPDHPVPALAGRQRGVATGSYADLWDWSVAEPAAFWDSIWDYFGVLGQRGIGPALTGRLPDAGWFPGATLNYARNALRIGRDRSRTGWPSSPPPRTANRAA